MADLALLDCFQPELVKLERVNYFPRQLLTADDMVADQDYFRQKLRRHNRFLHGWGVVCGLEVTAASTADVPWRVKIDAGFALGPRGDEIYVAEPVHIDLAKCGPGAVTDPCEPDLLHTGRSGVGRELFIAIKYAECVARPVRAMPAGCACEEEVCEYSRIRDSFQIECLTEHEPSPPGPLLCDLISGRRLPPCPPCPTEPWVVLAKVTLPPSPARSMADKNIDNFVRRQIYSTATLQEQLIKCCCKEEPSPARPARVISIDPPNRANFREFVQTLPTRIEILFDKRLQEGTVNEDTVQVRVSGRLRPLQRVAGTVQYEGGTNSARFAPSSPFEFDTAQTLLYEITVRGDGTNPIRDVDGLALDGDGDNLPGGDFVSQFTTEGVVG